MSYLGDEIRTQETTARRMSAELDDDTRKMRNTVEGAVWQSTAGDGFRSVLQGLLTDLEECRGEVEDLAQALGHHANNVEAHETAVADFVKWPFEQAKNAAVVAGEAIDDSLHAFERGVTTLAGAH